MPHWLEWLLLGRMVAQERREADLARVQADATFAHRAVNGEDHAVVARRQEEMARRLADIERKADVYAAEVTMYERAMVGHHDASE